ncbi:MAG: hypothetical protein KIG57_00475 [Muribaculaceae bacterium]|nr:hypothetical protein [Muribaculaceae bacterium]
MKNHPKITRQYTDKQLTTPFLIAKEPSLCNQKNRPFAIIYFSLNERAVATVCLPHAIKGLSFQHILLTHKTLSFFIPMVGEFLNMNPHSRCTPGKKILF